MKNKTSSNLTVLAILVLGGLFFCLAGCEKTEDGTLAETEFEVDEVYDRGPIVVRTRLSKSNISIAQTVLLELEVAVEPGYEVEIPEIAEVLEDFGIVDWQNLGDRLDENNNVVSTHRYRLEPFLSGDYAIPALVFRFSDVNSPDEKRYELITEPIDIKVTSLLGAERDELVIADIEDVVAMPKKASFWWAWAAGGVVIAVLLGGGFYLRSKRVAEIIRIFKSAHEIAYERLRALVKAKLIEAGRIKEFYEQISNILRHYIEDRFELRAPERTTEEFIMELSCTNILSQSDQDRLEEFLIHCDLVKFAKHDSTAEQVQKMFDLVKDFIEETKSEEKKIDITEMSEHKLRA